MTDQEVTQQFFEAIEVALRSVEQSPEVSLRENLEIAVCAIFSIMDGVAGYSGLPAFDITCKGQNIAPEDYIHEAWGRFCNR